MDSVFWFGIFLGTFLGLVGSIVGNLWTDKVREILDSQRRIRLSRKKSRELRTFFYVKALRAGDPTATLTLLIDQSATNRSTVYLAMAVTTLMFGVIAYRLDFVEAHLTLFLVGTGVILFCTLFLQIYSTTLSLRTTQIKYRLINFTDYEAKVRAKWGNDVFQ